MTTLNWTAIIVAFISLIGSIITAYFLYQAKKLDKKNNRIKNNNPGPSSFLCQIHGDRLLKIELRYDDVCKQLKLVQSELREIRLKIDG